MNWLTGIVVYILVWWVTLFAILPLWVTPADPEEPGFAAGAPRRPLMLRKVAATTRGGTIILVGLSVLVSRPWRSFCGPSRWRPLLPPPRGAPLAPAPPPLRNT